jgi:hypothetical protein
MEYVRGYFTVERNIIGLNLREMEGKLGFRPGRLTSGARILALQRRPSVGEFVFAGSTRFSNAEGLVSLDQRRKAASTTVPHAWLGQRLVKIVPNLSPTAAESYPSASSPVEQWELLVRLPAQEVGRLESQRPYWPRR